MKQGFEPRDTFLSGIDVMMVNTSQESTGDVVVQVLDMWGEPIGEGRLPLAEVSPGTYATVPMKVELDFSASNLVICLIFVSKEFLMPVIVSHHESIVPHPLLIVVAQIIIVLHIRGLSFSICEGSADGQSKGTAGLEWTSVLG